jgi:hypothetical protein
LAISGLGFSGWNPSCRNTRWDCLFSRFTFHLRFIYSENALHPTGYPSIQSGRAPGATPCQCSGSSPHSDAEADQAIPPQSDRLINRVRTIAPSKQPFAMHRQVIPKPDRSSFLGLQEDTAQTMIISKFLEPSDLILQSEYYSFCIIYRQWFHTHDITNYLRCHYAKWLMHPSQRTQL